MLQKVELHKMLLKKLESSPKGPCKPIDLIAHCLTKSEFTSSKITSFTWLKIPYNLVISFDGFASGCKVFITSVESGKTALLVLSSGSQIAAFISPSKTGLENILAYYVVFRFCLWGSLFWIIFCFIQKTFHIFIFQISNLLLILFLMFYTYFKFFVISEKT